MRSGIAVMAGTGLNAMHKDAWPTARPISGLLGLDPHAASVRTCSIDHCQYYSVTQSLLITLLQMMVGRNWDLVPSHKAGGVVCSVNHVLALQAPALPVITFLLCVANCHVALHHAKH